MLYSSLVQSFKSGDILYGLDGPRDVALKALECAGFVGKTPTGIEFRIQNEL